MGDASQVGSARRHAVKLAADLGFGEVLSGRLALVVTELGTNLVKHAQRGRLLIATRELEVRGGDRPDARHTLIEVMAIDSGPGIGNVAQCMGDGFSTGGSPGTGLGAIKRLADELEIHSVVPTGTIAVARVRDGAWPARAGGFRLGVVAIPKPGESVCGDAWIVVTDGARAAVMVADGLGHGPLASAASQAAVALFAKKAFEPLEATLTFVHAALRATRGAAVSVAQLDADGETIRSVGAGNVMMRVVSGTTDRTLLAQHGTVGVQMRTPQVITTAWPRHAILAIYSDGIMSRWPGKELGATLGRDPGLLAGLIARDFRRDRDDATIVVVRRKD